MATLNFVKMRSQNSGFRTKIRQILRMNIYLTEAPNFLSLGADDRRRLRIFLSKVIIG